MDGAGGGAHLSQLVRPARGHMVKQAARTASCSCVSASDVVDGVEARYQALAQVDVREAAAADDALGQLCFALRLDDEGEVDRERLLYEERGCA